MNQARRNRPSGQEGDAARYRKLRDMAKRLTYYDIDGFSYAHWELHLAIPGQHESFDAAVDGMPEVMKG